MISTHHLTRARSILIEQLEHAVGDPLLPAVSDLVDQLDQIIDGSSTYDPISLLPRPRIDPPASLLREMLATGRDLWVAGLIGWHRQEVRRARREFGMPAHSAGGDSQRRVHQHRRWRSLWAARLIKLGLWKE